MCSDRGVSLIDECYLILILDKVFDFLSESALRSHLSMKKSKAAIERKQPFSFLDQRRYCMYILTEK